MKNGESESRSEKMKAMKMEVEDSTEEEHVRLHKRLKQQSLGVPGIAVSVPQYDLFDEPSPLGLRLRKSPSLLELIQMKLSQSNSPKVGSQTHVKKESKASGAYGDKLKASNFPCSILRIGTWEYRSRYEGELVAKCYFAKHKLVWEVLDGGLKNKIEIQWSDIMALKASYPDDGPGTLDVVLAWKPLFFRETNPQPRKHTLWQPTSDFTGGQASIHRRHYLECPKDLLGKHLEKLTQSDPRLNFLSQQEVTLDSPYFNPKIPVIEDQNEKKCEFNLIREGSPFSSLQDTASPSRAQSSSSKNDIDSPGRHSESYPWETPSPSSVRDRSTFEDSKNGEIGKLKGPGKWDQISVPGLHSSTLISDLVSQLEHRISELGAFNNLILSIEEWQSLQILDGINRCLFGDFQQMPDSEEKSLMSRVNSLCCLLQKDSAAGSKMQFKSNSFPHSSLVQKREESNDLGALTAEKKVEENCSILNVECKDISGQNQVSSMPRKDSVGDLLLNLPRIASLPQFLFNIPEDFGNQAR